MWGDLPRALLSIVGIPVRSVTPSGKIVVQFLSIPTITQRESTAVVLAFPKPLLGVGSTWGFAGPVLQQTTQWSRRDTRLISIGEFRALDARCPV